MTTRRLLLVPALFVACLTNVGIADTPATQPDTSMPDLTEIKASVAELRELEFIKDVPAEQQSQEDFGKFLRAELEEMLPPDRRDDMQDGLLRLGLLLEEMDLGEEFANALMSQAAAYYDPRTDKFFYLMTTMPKAMLELTAAHELVHALQDQHFGLGDKMEELEEALHESVRNDDAGLAFQFLVEGEATYVMTLWQMKSTGMTPTPQMEEMSFRMTANLDASQLAQMSKMMAPEAGEDDPIAKAMAEIDQIPAYFMDPLFAAYMKGAYFAMKVKHAGGWEGIAEAFEDLPKSSEQVLHPEKYLDERDNPTPMSLDAVNAIMTEAGWTQIDGAVHGELFLDLLLRNFGQTKTRAAKAAAGWDGDVYHAYRSPSDEVMIVLATTWDTEQDASEFYEAYRKVLDKKYPSLTATDAAEVGTRVDLVCGPDLGDGVLLRRGREVFTIEGVPGDMVDGLVEAVTAGEMAYVE